MNPRRSRFDLSYNKLLTADMGLLYPIMCDEFYPGDYVRLGNMIVARMQPMVAPCMSPITIYCYYFFVPYRHLWEGWEDFITGGLDGNDRTVPPLCDWPVTNPDYNHNSGYYAKYMDRVYGYRPTYNAYDVGTLWDYFGFPVRKKPVGSARPLKFPFLAYNRVWWEYFRDENQVDTFYDDHVLDCDMPYLLPVAWKKDYFTSALPWQQRGTAPAIPLTGLASARWADSFFDLAGNAPKNFNIQAQRDAVLLPGGAYNAAKFTTDSNSRTLDMHNLMNTFNQNSIDLRNVGTFTVSDLRLMYAIQLWQELNARGGARYVEVIKSHFGFSPRDERLQRPEYIGGSKLPVVVSEVLQTSESTQTSPQGSMAGHGITVDGTNIGSYRVREHGVILGLLFIRPQKGYQDGINRQWLRKTRYDFMWPLLTKLSEQAIEVAEIFLIDNADKENRAIWGYQGRFDELRHKHDLVCGQMRSYVNDQASYGNGMTMPTHNVAGQNVPDIPPSLDYWHLVESYSTQPNLSWDFMMCRPPKRIFAVQDEPGFILNVRNIIKAVRPLPKFGIPGW